MARIRRLFLSSLANEVSFVVAVRKRVSRGLGLRGQGSGVPGLLVADEGEMSDAIFFNAMLKNF